LFISIVPKDAEASQPFDVHLGAGDAIPGGIEEGLLWKLSN
jgi:hypothetical protein